MYPYTQAPPMPGTLKAVRVILIIRVVLSAIIYALAFLGLAAVGGMSSAQVEVQLGMTVGVLVAVLLIGVAITAFEIYTVVRMGKGGFKARLLIRVVVGLALANALLSFLTDSTNPALGIVLMVVILVLIEKPVSKDWFHATDPDSAGVPGGPGGYPQAQGGYPGYPGQGGYPQGGQGGYPQGGYPNQGGYPDQGGYPQGGYPNQPGH